MTEEIESSQLGNSFHVGSEEGRDLRAERSLPHANGGGEMQLFILDVLTLAWLEDIHVNMQMGLGQRLGY